MPGRSRTQNATYSHLGTVHNWDGTVLDSATTSIGYTKQTDDWVGNRQGFNNFSSSQINRSGGLVSGTRKAWNGSILRTFNEVPIAALQHAVPDPTASGGYTMDAVRLNELALKLLAETNPGAAEVQIPSFLAELKDLPSLVRGYGLNLYRNVANATLQYRWGWKPLVADLQRMLSFHDTTMARFKQLDRLRKGLVLKKGKNLGFGLKRSVSTGFVAQSAHFWITGNWHDLYAERVWGTVQWYAPDWDNPFKDLSDDELVLKTRRILGGINSAGALAAAWEIIPWSWLAGWFSNVDNVINATANSTDMRHRGLCIMQHTSVYRTLEHSALKYGDYDLTMSPVLRRHERKKRFYVPYVLAFPTLRLPILTGGKLSIIAALTTLRSTPSERAAMKRLGQIALNKLSS